MDLMLRTKYPEIGSTIMNFLQDENYEYQVSSDPEECKAWRGELKKNQVLSTKQEFLSALEKGRPKLIIVDLPDRIFIESIRATCPGATIIGISNDEKLKRDFRKAGVTDFYCYTEGYSAHNLLEQIKEILG